MKVGEENLLGVIERGVYFVFVGEGIGGTHGGSRRVVPDQIVVLEEHLPSRLSARQTLWFFEVGQVLVVGDNRDCVGGPGEVLAPFC